MPKWPHRFEGFQEIDQGGLLPPVAQAGADGAAACGPDRGVVQARDSGQLAQPDLGRASHVEEEVVEVIAGLAAASAAFVKSWAAASRSWTWAGLISAIAPPQCFVPKCDPLFAQLLGQQ
jgi:hypothetical protein